MEALECIRSRQSIRKFERGEISEKEIHEILEAGFEAPSAMNRRPYELIVNTDNAFWAEFAKGKPTCNIFVDAVLTIVVVGDSNKNPTMEFLIEDTACVTQNILLAAKALGYGSLWAGVKFDSEFYNQLISHFQLPDGFLPISVIGIGIPGEKKPLVERYDEKKIHRGKFKRAKAK